MYRVFQKRPAIAVAAVTALLMVLPATASAGKGNLGPQRTVAGVDSLGEVRLPLDTEFDGTLVGGLSSVTYDKWRGVYYALSDDQADFAPVRYYTLDVDFSDGSLDEGRSDWWRDGAVREWARPVRDKHRRPRRSGSPLLRSAVDVVGGHRERRTNRPLHPPRRSDSSRRSTIPAASTSSWAFLPPPYSTSRLSAASAMPAIRSSDPFVTAAWAW